MKISYRWCQQFLPIKIDPASLGAILTDRGLEIDEISTVAESANIIVGRILSIEKIGKKNHCCQVDIGNNTPLTIVCGAANVIVGGLVAIAPVGATIQGVTITARTIDNTLSEGMICSAAELGIVKDSEGILLFSDNDNVELGDCLDSLFLFNDTIYDVGITPNRGDCLSHLGIAREIAAAMNTSVIQPEHRYQPDHDDIWPISIAESAKQACPYYNALLIRDVNCSQTSPWWLQSYLERCANRSINIAVDITNYIMLAVGQPMHAFDADKLNQHLTVRFANDKEKVTVLTEKIIDCKADTLLIADAAGGVALGGVMGGLDSSVTAATRNILLECAFFESAVVRGRSRDFNLNSDAAFRYERGVDPQLPISSIQKGADLIRQIAGGKAGPVNTCGAPPNNQKTIELPVSHILKVLGINIDTPQAMAYLNGLQINTQENNGILHCTTPPWRFDLKIKEDIIEEIVRSWGYSELPETMPVEGRELSYTHNAAFSHHQSRLFFVHHGFHEIISYAFVPSEWEDQLSIHKPLALINPISEDMSVMRTTLFGGLLKQALFNYRHRNDNIKLFEIGRCFFSNSVDDLPSQPNFLGGVIVSSALPVLWDSPKKELDFFDIKGLLEKYLGSLESIKFRRIEPKNNKALHPNKSADIICGETIIGQIGELNPTQILAREFPVPVLLFSLSLDTLASLQKTRSLKPVSIFPVVQRDLSLVIDSSETAGVGQIIDHIRHHTLTLPIVAVDLFDLFEKDEATREKIIGIRLKLQKFEENFKGEEINTIILDILNNLKQHFKLRLRGE